MHFHSFVVTISLLRYDMSYDSRYTSFRFLEQMSNQTRAAAGSNREEGGSNAEAQAGAGEQTDEAAASDGADRETGHSQ